MHAAGMLHAGGAYRTSRVSLVVDSTTLRSVLFALAALFTRLANSFLLVILLVRAALLTRLLVSLRILTGRLMAALLASVKAAFFHSLIAIAIVRHIFFPLLFTVELKLWAFRERPAHTLKESTGMPAG